MWADVLLIAGAYILGAAPHLLLLAKLRHVEVEGDLHQDLWHRAGKITGVVGVLGEFIKGALPVLVGKALDFNTAVVAAAGLAAVCGQMWPVFLKFDGEKGNSIGVAMAMALAPLTCLLAMTPVVIALLVRTAPRLTAKTGSGQDEPIIGGSYSRSLPLGMFTHFLLLPFIAWGWGEPKEIVWCFGALFILIIIRRLTAGLQNDLKTTKDIKGILLRRLLYDRATVN